MMTPEHKCHRAQRRFNAGERIIQESIDENNELADELGAPQTNKDEIAAEGQALKDQLKRYHDALTRGCGSIGVQPLAGDDKNNPNN